jgi:hypothetical protein
VAADKDHHHLPTITSRNLRGDPACDCTQKGPSMNFFGLADLHLAWRFRVPGLLWLGIWHFGPDMR